MARHPETEANQEPNDLLRNARLSVRSRWDPRHPMGRREFADEINKALVRLYPDQARGKKTSRIATFFVTPYWVGVMERGERRTTSAERRAAVREVTGKAHDYELGFYPQRPRHAHTLFNANATLLSVQTDTTDERLVPKVETHAVDMQRQASGFADSESMMASDDSVAVNVEIEGRDHIVRLSRRALLQAAQGATAAMMLPKAGPGCALPASVRSAILITGPFDGAEPPAELPRVQRSVSRLHVAYQQAAYDEAVASVPALMDELSSLSDGAEGDGRQDIATTITFGHLAVSKLALKFGDAQLAWLAADRAQRWAARTGAAALSEVIVVAIGSALLALPGREQDAAAIVERTLSTAHGQRRDPVELSVLGALHLLAASIADRFNDHSSARNHLGTAGNVAELLGGDRNDFWTAFGPTNVLIHQVGFAAAHNPDEAIAIGERVDTTSLHPALASRRSQVHLDLAAAFASRSDGDASAVLHLLQVEEWAPQLLMVHPPARSLILRLMARERAGTTPGLRSLASRVGLAA